MKILTWMWKQPNARFEYTAAHVNAWAQSIAEHCTRPVTVACVTDHPEGIEDWIEIIKPPHDFDHVTTPTWRAERGLPQCFRRLAMFAPDAGKVFGTRWMCMDLDALIVGNLDHLIDIDTDFAIFRGTSSKRPYNGGLIIMDAGARTQVYTEFTPEKAALSGQMYVGSDQAWISYCLGKGERTIGDKEGVYHYSPRFVRVNGGSQFVAPRNTCILFYPGNTKIFANGDCWQAQSQDKLIAEACIMKDEIILAYDDPKNWGKAFVKDNQNTRLIKTPDDAEAGDRVFVRLDQQGLQRGKSKMFVKALAKKGVETLPTAKDAEHYDDKGRQLEILKDWMPRTWHIQDKQEALRVAGELPYPIISKSVDGAGSGAVRVLESHDQAKAEVEAAFSRKGMPSVYTRKQKGYVYWQEIVGDNPCDYRVVVTGPYVFGLVRNNKAGTIFASGSGDNYPITLKTSREIAAMRKGIEVAKAIGTEWMAFDFVFDGETPLVLEMSSAWTAQPYFDCKMFDFNLKSTELVGADMFRVAHGILSGAYQSQGEAMDKAEIESEKVQSIAPKPVPKAKKKKGILSKFVTYRKVKSGKVIVAERGSERAMRMARARGVWEEVRR